MFTGNLAFRSRFLTLSALEVCYFGKVNVLVHIRLQRWQFSSFKAVVQARARLRQPLGDFRYLPMSGYRNCGLRSNAQEMAECCR
jgi:hypothetical protein